MEPRKPKLPIEAVQLYNEFIHGHISRRDFFDGARKFAVGGLAAGTIIDMLMPELRGGAAGLARPTRGSRPVTRRCRRRRATAASRATWRGRPAPATTKLPGILVVHENRGLNPHIEDVARRFALANFMAFAPDGLTSVGGYPGDDVKGGELFGKVDRAKMTEDFVAAAIWLKNRARQHRQDRRRPASASAAASPTRWPFAWAPISRRPRRSTAARRWRPTSPKIKAAILVHHGGARHAAGLGLAGLRQR